jgi:hypothetical protein
MIVQHWIIVLDSAFHGWDKEEEWRFGFNWGMQERADIYTYSWFEKCHSGVYNSGTGGTLVR